MSEFQFEKIRAYLRNTIIENKKNNNYKDHLPSENFLATKFKVSRQTARKELLNLLNKGLIISKKGAGYFINPNINFFAIKSVAENKNNLFTTIEKINNSYIDVIIDVLNLNLKASKYFGYKKVYYQDGKPIIIIRSFIYKDKFEKIDLNKIKDSLFYFIIENKIEIETQTNKLIMKQLSSDDKELFGDIGLVPTVYGTLLNSNDEIIEVFEKQTIPNKFEYTSIKKL